MVSSTTPKHLPPGPEEHFSLTVNQESLAFLERAILAYGDCFRVQSTDRKDDSYVLLNPEHVKHVLLTNSANYRKGVGFERVKMLLGNGIIVSDGDHWRRQRTMLQPAFKQAKIADLSRHIKASCLAVRDQWRLLARDRATIDITTAMSQFGLDVILRCIFSDDLEGICSKAGGNPFAFLASDSERDLNMAKRFRELSQLVRECVEERRTSGARPADFLSDMIDARDKRTGEGMSDKEIVDEVNTMIIAGHETSAGTLNWAWYLISRHPEVEAKLLAELDAGILDDDVQLGDVMHLSYMRQVLLETLRLYPPVWLYTRRAIADDQLGDYAVPAGTHIYLSPYLLHRQAGLWPEPEPEAFHPDRFAAGSADKRHRQAYIPFSAGARRCIGEHFAFVEMQMHLAIMLREFKLTHVPDKPITIDLAINLRTLYPIYMSLEPRMTDTAK
jgi:cytochrome P450